MIKSLFDKKLSLIKKKSLIIGLLVIGVLLIFLGIFKFSDTAQIVTLSLAIVVIVFSIFKLSSEGMKDTAVKVHNYKILEEEVEKLREEVNKREEEKINFEKRLEEEKNKKVQILNIQPIINLGLIEAECEITRFHDKYFDSKDERIYRQENAVKRFIGVITKKFTATYGIEMENLKIRADNTNKIIYVSGAEPKYMGLKGFPKTNWKLAMSFKRYRDIGIKYIRSNDWVEDNSVKHLVDKHKTEIHSELEESLNKGPEELEWIKKPLEETVKNFLKLMITPHDYKQEYKIELVRDIGEHYDSFIDFMKKMVEFKGLPADTVTEIIE